MNTAVKVVLWILGSVLTLLLLGLGVLWWGLSGGWDGIRPAAQPEDREVVAAREAAREPLERLAVPIEQELVPDGKALAPQSVDQCATGQNNWKVEDGFTLECSQARVIGVETSGTSLPDVAAQVDARVQALGWRPGSHGQMEVLLAGDRAEGRYANPDDPAATLVLEVAAPGAGSPYVFRDQGLPTWSEGDDQPLLDQLEASSEVTVFAAVERTYFRDD